MSQALSPVTVRQRNHKYSLHDKKKFLIQLQESNLSIRDFSKVISVDEKSLRYWKKSIDTSLDYSKTQKTLHPGRSPVGEHLEMGLVKFIDDLRETNNDVTVELVTIEAMRMDPEFQDGEFQKVRYWIYRFLERNSYSIRGKTHIAQKDIDIEQCQDFVEAVKEPFLYYGSACFMNSTRTPFTAFSDSNHFNAIDITGRHFFIKVAD
jgi:hypothetical protein